MHLSAHQWSVRSEFRIAGPSCRFHLWRPKVAGRNFRNLRACGGAPWQWQGQGILQFTHFAGRGMHAYGGKLRVADV